jgi:hypothetical protein
MKNMIDTTTRNLTLFFIMFMLIISGGLFSAEAADSKATFTVQ